MPAAREEAARVFRESDINGDGQIDLAELGACPALAPPEARQHAPHLLDDCRHLLDLAHVCQLQAEHVRPAARAGDPREILLDDL